MEKKIDLFLVGVESRLRIHPAEDSTLLPETKLLPRLREMKLRHTGQSEGYETMMKGSADIASEVTKQPLCHNNINCLIIGNI